MPGVQVKEVRPPVPEGATPSSVLINLPPPRFVCCFSRSVLSNSWRPHRLRHSRLLRPGDFFRQRYRSGFPLPSPTSPMGPSQIKGQRRLLQRDHTLDPLLGRKPSSPLSPLSSSPAPRLLWGSVGPPAAPPADSSTSAAGIFERTFPHPLPRLLKTPNGFPLGPAVLRTLGWASPRPLGLRPLRSGKVLPGSQHRPAPHLHPSRTTPPLTNQALSYTQEAARAANLTRS